MLENRISEKKKLIATAKLSPKDVKPIYVPANSVWEFLFSQAVANIRFCVWKKSILIC